MSGLSLGSLGYQACAVQVIGVLGRRHGKQGKGGVGMSVGCLQVTVMLDSLRFPRPLHFPESEFRAMGSSFELSHLLSRSFSKGCWCGPWKELESSIFYHLTSGVSQEFSTKSRPAVVVNNPAEGDRRGFEVEPAVGSQAA